MLHSAISMPDVLCPGAAEHDSCPRGERDPLSLIRLTSLMELTSGRSEVTIGLVDGPVASDHPDLAASKIRQISPMSGSADTQADDGFRSHATFVAGMLSARKGAAALGLCRDCTLLVRPIFGRTKIPDQGMPGASPEELAAAIVDCIRAGAWILNLSLSIAQPSTRRESALEDALDYAARSGVVVVAAAGNQGTIGSSVITRHYWVVPVVACDLQGRPLGASNLAGSIGRRGLTAPGVQITSLGPEGKPLTLSGTSFAVPFVTAAVALLWSAFPSSTAVQVRSAVTRDTTGRRTSVVPPLLDASASYQIMLAAKSGGAVDPDKRRR
jgi:subtilisin family serine protease